MTHSARRINQLLTGLGFSRYLEIGVNRGETFRLVEAGCKVGVDPQFLFPTGEIESETVRCAEMTSDAYFAGLPADETFDLIFIDGLHVFEQVVRDFSNAVLHTHARSVILLDDTQPSDIFSSLPNLQESVALRAVFNTLSQDWHGDVFKMVYYINDFWPGLEFRTLVTGGNAQTLVWRKPGRGRPPVCRSLEAISRLGFFDLCRDTSVLRPVSEEEGLQLCIADIGRPSAGDAAPIQPAP